LKERTAVHLLNSTFNEPQLLIILHTIYKYNLFLIDISPVTKVVSANVFSFPSIFPSKSTEQKGFSNPNLKLRNQQVNMVSATGQTNNVKMNKNISDSV
jgi:hypothetical protein